MSEHQNYRASLYTSKGRDDVRRVMQLLEQNFRAMPHYYPHYRMTWWALRKNVEAVLADRTASLMFEHAMARGHTSEAIEACLMHRQPEGPAAKLVDTIATRGWSERVVQRPMVTAAPREARGVPVAAPAQTLGAILDDIEAAISRGVEEPPFERMPLFSEASPDDLLALIQSAQIEEVSMDASPRALMSRGYVFTVDGAWHTPDGVWSAPPGRLIRDSAARNIFVADSTAVVMLLAVGDAQVRDRVTSLAVLAAHAEWELLISTAVSKAKSLENVDDDSIDRLLRNAAPINRDTNLSELGEPEDVFLLPLRQEVPSILRLDDVLANDSSAYMPAIGWSREHLTAIVPAMGALHRS